MTPNISAAFFNTFAVAFAVLLLVGVAVGVYAAKTLKRAEGPKQTDSE